MKKLYVLLVLSFGSLIQGAEQPQLVEKSTFKTGMAHANSVSWNRDEVRLAAGVGIMAVPIPQRRQLPALYILARDTGTCLNQIKEHENSVRSVACHPDGERVASGADDKMTRIFDFNTGKCLQQIRGDHQVGSVRWNQDSIRLASGESSTLRISDTNTGQSLQRLTSNNIYAQSLDWHKDGERIASESTAEKILIFDCRTGNCVQELDNDCGNTYPRSVRWNQDGIRLASGYLQGIVRTWDIRTGKFIHSFMAPRGATRSPYDSFLNMISSLDWHLDGKRLAVACRNKIAYILDSTDSSCLQELTDTLPVYSVRWSPSGHRLAMGAGYAVRFWEYPGAEAKEAAELVLTPPPPPVPNVPVSGDSEPEVKKSAQQILIEKERKALSIPDSLLAVAQKHYVTSLACSNDGQLHEADSYQLIDRDLQSIAFDPSGRSLLTSSNLPVENSERINLTSLSCSDTGQLTHAQDFRTGYLSQVSFHPLKGYLAALNHSALTGNQVCFGDLDNNYEDKGAIPLKDCTLYSLAHHPLAQYLAIAYLKKGEDKAHISTYAIDKDKFTLLGSYLLNAEFIHLKYHPSGYFIAATNQRDNNVTAFYSSRAGWLMKIATFPTNGDKSCCSVYPNGRSLITANTNSNDLTYSESDIYGQLQFRKKYPSGNHYPVGLACNSTGKILAVAHRNKIITTFLHNDDELTPAGTYSTAGNPICLAFRPPPTEGEKKEDEEESPPSS